MMPIVCPRQHKHIPFNKTRLSQNSRVGTLANKQYAEEGLEMYGRRLPGAMYTKGNATAVCLENVDNNTQQSEQC